MLPSAKYFCKVARGREAELFPMQTRTTPEKFLYGKMKKFNHKLKTLQSFENVILQSNESAFASLIERSVTSNNLGPQKMLKILQKCAKLDHLDKALLITKLYEQYP